MMEKRVLGLDIGTKRIGVALSDPLGITAQPMTTIARKPDQNSVDKIKKICTEYDVSLIVAGLPKNMDGTLGFQAQDVLSYLELIKKSISINIELEDERLTSKIAESVLIEQKVKPSRQKGLVDVTSAILILQQYLDKNKRR